ncbi:Uncharacterised protein [Vibrio cholerae]|nr:Uncharacterised protein [Vibrio cholerae]CSI66607.1 Uncharacterised protein [Vibrio cholerae]
MNCLIRKILRLYFMLFALGAATAYYWNLQKSTPSKI